MSLINVTNINVGNNCCKVTVPLVFQIEFECLEDLKNDVEWKVIYVTSDGSGYNDESHDDTADYLKSDNDGEIVLDAVCLGPVFRGILEFEFRVNPPDYSRMNPDSILGMQAILVTASYCEQEFIRIGYYTNNCYEDELLRENPPDVPNLSKMVRCIIDQPRVTRFPIRWDSESLVDHEGNNLDCLTNEYPTDLASSEDSYTHNEKEDTNEILESGDTPADGSESCDGEASSCDSKVCEDKFFMDKPEICNGETSAKEGDSRDTPTNFLNEDPDVKSEMKGDIITVNRTPISGIQSCTTTIWN